MSLIITRRRFSQLSALGLISGAGLSSLPGHAAPSPIEINHPNFFTFRQNGEMLYPAGANAGGLIAEHAAPAQRAAALDRLKKAGVNVLRVNLESAVPSDAPLSRLIDESGAFLPEIIARFSELAADAAQRNISVIPVLFDLTAMLEDWKQSRYNAANGGPCQSIAAFFEDVDQQRKALKRLESIVTPFQGKNIFAFEIVRGLNSWEHELPADPEDRKRGLFWYSLLFDRFRRLNQQKHLSAATCLPNTLPGDIASAADVLFLHIRSHAALLVGQSMPRFLRESRTLGRPVYISEFEWSGRGSSRDETMQTVFWASLAYNSSTFISPTRESKFIDFAGSDLVIIDAQNRFLPMLDFSGQPRPASEVPPEIIPKDEFLLIDNIVGMNRYFWLMRRNPGESKAVLKLRTVEGVYEFQWFDLRSLTEGKSKQFTLFRNDLMVQTPVFDHWTMGVLRLVEKGKPPRSGEPEEKNPSGPDGDTKTKTG
ncbi:MAG: hypothetical protein GC154_18375 [bacterium]|nr:hypothetical protein [bacterium]